MPLGLQTASLNFETLKEIGQAGRNSQVFLAHDHQLNGELVVKKIRKDCITYDGDFYKEAKILYSSDHLNIVKVIYGCEDTDHVYIAMPFYKNGSLKGLIDKKFLTVRETIRYAIHFLSGLHHIHSKGLIHFDIKLDNIFLSDSDEAMLADFGLAKAMNIYGVADQEYLYPKQLPTEVLMSADYTILFDIYLVGLTLYRMCNGNKIFDDQFLALIKAGKYPASVLNGTFPNRQDYLYHIPPALRKVINKAISVNSNDRHQNVLSLINEISAIDTLLDWRYSKDADSEQWQIEKDDKFITVILKKNGHNFAINTTKMMKLSGNTTKIHDYCVANMVSNGIRAYIQKALKELE
jgi:serine/threonine protein kinase